MAPTTRNAGKTNTNPIKTKAKPKPGKLIKKVKAGEKIGKKVNIATKKVGSVAKKANVDKKKPELPAEEEEDTLKTNDWKYAKSIYDFTVNNIKGEPVSLKSYEGHVCIIVNVASRCGHTKSNYEQLVKLDEKYGKTKGLKILAFPCNQFGSQEPGDSDKICQFVEKKNVKFDMFEKIFVNGPKAHPLFKYLKEKLVDPKTKAKDIKWNFAKFIIDKNGQPMERFVSATKPITLVENLEKYW